jgi:hypothetical protein
MYSFDFYSFLPIFYWLFTDLNGFFTAINPQKVVKANIYSFNISKPLKTLPENPSLCFITAWS